MPTLKITLSHAERDVLHAIAKEAGRSMRVQAQRILIKALKRKQITEPQQSVETSCINAQTQIEEH